MKVLLFSHGSDIDGMGSIILSNLAFEKVDYHFSEINTLDEQILEEINSNNIYNYDQIFVTDLTPKNETLDIIENNSKLKEKLVVIDHHKTNYNRASNYSFVHITIENDKGQTSATSLFYEYLVNNKLLKENKVIEYYAELTRLEDTWTWINNNELAHDLAILFNILGIDKYIDTMINKLKEKEFILDEKEKVLVEYKKKDIIKHIEEYTKYMKEITINNHKGIIVIIDYEYRNDLPEYLRKNNKDIEFAMMVCFNHNSISFRTVNNCNVREIAETFGGGGHDKASSCYINEKLDKIYEVLLEK